MGHLSVVTMTAAPSKSNELVPPFCDIKMVRYWWNNYWAQSEGMLRILAFFQKLYDSGSKFMYVSR